MISTRPDEPERLDQSQVIRLIEFMKGCDPIIVGGQSLNLWAEYYAHRDPLLAVLGPFTSKDLDLFVNPKAASALANSLEEGSLRVAGLDDMTANAAVVTGKIDGRHIIVDFLATVMGVEDHAIMNEYVVISGHVDDREVSLLLMNPRDCLKSRLNNVNKLHREDSHSINQTSASIKVLSHFLDDLLSVGEIEFVQRTLCDLEYVIRAHHISKPSHIRHGAVIDPSVILERYIDDERLDRRWREHTLRKAAARTRRRSDGKLLRRN